MQPVFLFLSAGKINRPSPLQTLTPIHLEHLLINFFSTMFLKISCSRIRRKQEDEIYHNDYDKILLHCFRNMKSALYIFDLVSPAYKKRNLPFPETTEHINITDLTLFI